jgi:cell division protein FtsN
MRQMTHQRGGTFLGLVLGLVVGLGIALAVAVYVTKVPVPFLNKGQSRSGEQDAAEAKKNKDWDPNVLIQGKTPVRASSGAVTPSSTTGEPMAVPPSSMEGVKPKAKAEPVPEPKVATVVGSKPDSKSETKPEAKKPVASVDPLGDLVAAQSTKQPAKPAGADPFTYMVQTGAFRTEVDANAQRAKLSLVGVEVKVTEREQAGRTVYRVRAGPFEHKSDADAAKEKLATSGFETVLVRIQK